MSANFDPYHEWLGIAPDEQPADYYRLLGLKLFESNPDVISNAADARMAYVRTFQTGRRSQDTQRILNELSLARTSLLNPKRRTEYDAGLRDKIEAAKPKTQVVAKAFPSKATSIPQAVPLPVVLPQPLPLLPLLPPHAEQPSPVQSLPNILGNGPFQTPAAGYSNYGSRIANERLPLPPLWVKLLSGSVVMILFILTITMLGGRFSAAPPREHAEITNQVVTPPEGTITQPPLPQPPLPQPPLPQPPLPQPPLPQPPVPAPPVPAPPSEPTPASEEAKPTEPTLTPTPAPKPEPAPVPKPPPSKKLVLDFPFRELPKVALLPAFGTDGNVPADALQEKVFGKMYLANALCFLELHGGEGAVKGSKQFVMKSADNKTSTTDYEIYLKSGSDSASAPVIAKIFVGEAFKFQWQPAALETPGSSYLLNCVLAMNAGQFKHEVRFREVQSVEPLMINAPPKPVAGKWNTDFLPATEHLKIEFLGVDGINKHKFDKKTIACLGDTGIVWIGKMSTPLGIKITPLASRLLELKGQFLVKTDEDEKEQPFKAKLVEQMLALTDNATQMIERRLMQQTNVSQSAERKKQFEQQADAERQKVAKLRNEWQGVGDAIAILKAPAAVHFRLYFETKEGKQIDILTSKPGAPPANGPKT